MAIEETVDKNEVEDLPKKPVDNEVVDMDDEDDDDSIEDVDGEEEDDDDAVEEVEGEESEDK